MPRLLERVDNLKGKSIDELRVRCVQAVRARLERIGLSAAAREPSHQAFRRLFDRPGTSDRLVDGGELLEQFRQGDQGLARCFSGLGDPTATAREFQARCPRAAKATIAAAERISAGVFGLGNRVLSLGARPDWTSDPVSGTCAPAIHWSRIAILDPLVVGDCKLTWELNRHQYFLTLGQAYLLAGDDRYASLVADHLSTWIDDNPPKVGINWTSSLELALRAISWTWALYLVRTSSCLGGDLFLRALKYLYLHARHIERYLSTYSSPNTHLTGEALGLLYVGTAFPQFTRAHHWRALGCRILIEQLDRQLFNDGVYFEQSTYYHRYTTDFYLHALLLTQWTEPSVAGIIRSKLRGLLDHLLFITRPDGRSPLIGDDDGGRLILLGPRPANDFRDTLAIGAAVLQRGDYAYVAGNSVEELLWLLGPKGIQTYDNLTATPPATTSRVFTDSGYFVMRESWDSAGDWAVVRCGPHAPRTGAHAHADALAIELSVAGQPMLIDPGTYVYAASREERDYFRSSAAHNTVTVDGRSSAEPGASVFRWKSVPRSRATAWVHGASFDFFEGEHDGYLQLDAPAIHSRAVFFLKGEYWVIRDRIRSNGRHHLAAHWHWAPGVTVSSDTDTLRTHAGGGEALQVSARIFSGGGRLACHEGWVSSAYGTRTRAPISVFEVDSARSGEIVAVITSSSRGVRLEDCAWRAAAPERSGVLTIATASTRDTILTGTAADAESVPDGIVSDATWTWVRRSLDGELLAFALIQGRTLIVDNQCEFQGDTAVQCAIGRHGKNGWRVDVQSADGWSTIRSISSVTRIDDSCVASAE